VTTTSVRTFKIDREEGLVEAYRIALRGICTTCMLRVLRQELGGREATIRFLKEYLRNLRTACRQILSVREIGIIEEEIVGADNLDEFYEWLLTS